MIQILVLAPSQLLCRLLSSKNDPVIKYTCMQIRVLLCTESGTALSLNWNEPVIKCACMLTRYNCALNRELLCFDIQTCMTKREQLCLTRAIVLKGSGRICHLHIISDNNLFTLVTSCLLSSSHCYVPFEDRMTFIWLKNEQKLASN